MARNQINGFDADDPRFRIKPYQQIVSSVTGALITSFSMTPLDVVKTRLQAQQKILLSNKCYLYCNGLMDHLCPCGPNSGPQTKTVRFNGTIDALVKISKSEGVPSLWSGLGPTLVLALPTTVLYFVAYEQLRVRLKDYHKTTLTNVSDEDYKLPMWIPLVSGCAARCFAVTVVNPLELIRTKMQSERMSYLEVRKGFQAMIKSTGWRGLFTGLLPTILRDAPFSSIYWTTYELYKNFYNVTIPNFSTSFVGGAFAGSVAAFCTTPFDVIKTHQQIEFGEKVFYSDNGKGKPSGTKSIMKNIYKSQGIRGFFAGLTPRLFKVAPACAIMISSFEYGKSYFHKYNMIKYYEKEQKRHPRSEFSAAEILVTKN